MKNLLCILAVVAFSLGDVSASAADAKIPEPLQRTLRLIDVHIAKGSSLAASSECIDYAEVSAAFERKWWRLLGYRSQPAREAIEKDPRLRHFAMIVKLSSESFCGSARGIQRLLYGGAGGDEKLNDQPMSGASLLSIGQDTANFAIQVPGANPTTAILKKQGDVWRLTTIDFEMRAPQ